MIKIKQLKVKNFKSLIDSNIEEFGDVNMFYGFNNSGKSNVFKFLEILFARKKDRQIVKVETKDSVLPITTSESLISIVDFWDGRIYDKPYIFSDDDRTKDIEFEVRLELSNDMIPETVLLNQNGFLSENETEILLQGKIVGVNSNESTVMVNSSSLNGKNFYVIEDDIPYGFKGLQVEGLDVDLAEKILSLLNDCVQFIDTDRNFTEEIFNNGATELSHKSFKNWLFELNINAEKNDVFQDLAKFLSSFEFTPEGSEKLGNNIDSFPFRGFTDIGFSRFGNEIEIMLKNKVNRLPLSSFGTGIQQFFFILTRIFMNNSKIVIIEELELNLAPIYQKELMIFIKSILGEKFDQLLFSSHSPFFTLKDSSMVDVVQHVQIGNSALNLGTTIESHTELHYDEETNQSYFSLLYS